MIYPGKIYKVVPVGENKSYSEFYFTKKYGTQNPLITVEGTDVEVCGKSWGNQVGIPGAILFGMRTGMSGVDVQETTLKPVYYGKIRDKQGFGLGEFVMEAELQEVTDEDKN